MGRLASLEHERTAKTQKKATSSYWRLGGVRKRNTAVLALSVTMVSLDHKLRGTLRYTTRLVTPEKKKLIVCECAFSLTAASTQGNLVIVATQLALHDARTLAAEDQGTPAGADVVQERKTPRPRRWGDAPRRSAQIYTTSVRRVGHGTRIKSGERKMPLGCPHFFVAATTTQRLEMSRLCTHMCFACMVWLLLLLFLVLAIASFF